MNHPSPPATHDDGLQELRDIRRNITGSFQHDQTALGAHLRQREAEPGPANR